MKIRIKVPTRLAESLEDKARKAVEEAKEAVANAKKEKQLKQLEELKAKVDDKIAMLKGKKGKKQKVEEGLINEGIIDLSQTAVDLLMDKNKFATKPGSSTGVFTVYDLSRPKGAASFGDDMASQKVGFLYTPESKYKAYKLESDDENTVKKITALKESQLDEEEQLGDMKKDMANEGMDEAFDPSAVADILGVLAGIGGIAGTGVAIAKWQDKIKAKNPDLYNKLASLGTSFRKAKGIENE